MNYFAPTFVILFLSCLEATGQRQVVFTVPVSSQNCDGRTTAVDWTPKVTFRNISSYPVPQTVTVKLDSTKAGASITIWNLNLPLTNWQITPQGSFTHLSTSYVTAPPAKTISIASGQSAEVRFDLCKVWTTDGSG